MTGAMWLGWMLWAWPVVAGTPGDHVVARARGARGEVVITAARLEAYAVGRAGTPARELVRELVDFELLAAEAEARGYADDREVREQTEPALVLRFLMAEFEPTWTAATLPDEMVRASYAQNLRFFVRPALRRADHIIVTQGEGSRPEDPALDAQAAGLARKIYEAITADPPADADDFRARAEAFVAEGEPLGLTVRAESLGRFAEVGRYDKVFTQAVFQITQAGTVMEPFPTKFGHHIVRVDTIEEARDTPYEGASAELRQRIVPEVRTLKVRELTDELAQTYNARLNAAPLEQLAERRGVPEPE